jgi:hypothetical protein
MSLDALDALNTDFTTSQNYYFSSICRWILGNKLELSFFRAVLKNNVQSCIKRNQVVSLSG